MKFHGGVWVLVGKRISEYIMVVIGSAILTTIGNLAITQQIMSVLLMKFSV